MSHQLDSQLDYYLDEITSSYHTSYNEDLDDAYAHRDTSYETLASRHHV